MQEIHAQKGGLFVPDVVGSLCADSHPGGYSGQDAYTGRLVTHSLRADGFDVGDVRTTHAVVAFQCHGTNVGEMGTLRKGNGSVTSGVPFVATAFHVTQDPISGDVSPCVSQGNSHGCVTLGVSSVTGVRRLTPRECCRLQGFPDDYLDIPYRGKPASDGPKYKALGNSMATNVMRWIGERIAEVEAIS